MFSYLTDMLSFYTRISHIGLKLCILIHGKSGMYDIVLIKFNWFAFHSNTSKKIK